MPVARVGKVDELRDIGIGMRVGVGPDLALPLRRKIQLPDRCKRRVVFASRGIVVERAAVTGVVRIVVRDEREVELRETRIAGGAGREIQIDDLEDSWAELVRGIRELMPVRGPRRVRLRLDVVE